MFDRVLQYYITFLFILGINCEYVDLEIPQGSLRGESRTNIDGGTFYAFKGIPFGKPPVGEYRFRVRRKNITLFI